VQALILDYGEVLSVPQSRDALRAMADATGVALDAFEPAYWRHRRAYDIGLPARDYWTATLADLRAPGDDLIDRLIALDVESWTHYREEVWDIAAAVRRAGQKTAILSNGVPEVMARVRRDRDLPALFDAVIVSYEVGHAKPDAGIYQLTLSRLGVAAGDSLFVDDRAENITAAAALGMETLHFTGDDKLQRLRARLNL
jgi:putative hydrolase of the HAD superfamily